MMQQPDHDQFADELIAYISSEVATADEDIDRTTDLLLSGLVDSLGVVMVSDWVQQRLGIVIDPVDIVLEHFQTVEALLRYAIARDALAR